jgi:uncharacterized protein (TIGR00251 family)
MVVVALDARETDRGTTIRVRVKPKASRSRILGERDGVLEVSLAAPPVDGEANAELVRTLARQLRVAQTSIELVSGRTARTKLISVHGIGLAELQQRLGL